jgi:hypothetical protein
MSITFELDRVWGFAFALKNMRLSHSSEDKSDSSVTDRGLEIIGKKDRALALKLIKAGPSHSKFMRFIRVHCLIKAPLKWWKHFDTYKYAEKLSSSTMHTIMKHTLTKDDFSVNTHPESINIVNSLIQKGDFSRVVDSLPDGFLQLRAVDTNYACLRNIYFQWRNHRLDEWKELCACFLNLPESDFITLPGGPY